MRKSTTPPKHSTIPPHQRAISHSSVANTSESPTDWKEWQALGLQHLQANDLAQAQAALAFAVDLAPDEIEARVLLGRVATRNGDETLAHESFERAVALNPLHFGANVGLGDILCHRNQLDKALSHYEKALEAQPENLAALQQKAHILGRQRLYEDAAKLCEQLIARGGDSRYANLNELGNIRRDLGQLDIALECYRQAAKQSAADPAPLSNQITISHYLPECSPAEIFKLSKLWGRKFAKRDSTTQRAIPVDRSPGRTLRIGMISDGFRQHPVGAMVTTALEELRQFGFELYFYSTSAAVDAITVRLQNIATQWTIITKSSDEALAQRIRDDGIDILIDLAGHNSGSRMRTIAMEPAPLIVKWVGGLINTTGVESFDYLITDGIESPPGSDDMYTEKLIRMPDDYICYMPPQRIPPVASLPAERNGYITFGCFNNPTKVNDVLLEQWARVLHAVPGSRLYLKGGPFNSPDLQRRVLATLARHDIDASRVQMEGHSKHYQLFECYNNVDIALDPWPYSGGLTTCEAMLMGVPVVTLPGPTFAGRHSATHMINAGMPELVVNDWEEYISRAKELASDIQSLSTIRKHLRDILLASPVCNAGKFAKHLADALRSIWKRYCEGRQPAALAFTPEGLPWFEDEDAPMEVSHPDIGSGGASDQFSFALNGKIIAVDHGASLAQAGLFSVLDRLGSVALIVLDPAGRLEQPGKHEYKARTSHYQAYTALGDGNTTTLYACLDDSFSGTLEPRSFSSQTSSLQSGATVLTTLSIPSVRLDEIVGLDQVDWLILDDTNDNTRILANASRILTGAPVIQVGIRAADDKEQQRALAEMETVLKTKNYRLLRVIEAAPKALQADLAAQPSVPETLHRASLNAVFTPDESLVRTISADQRWKIAFLLHTAYQCPKDAYEVLQAIDPGQAEHYWKQNGLASQPTQPKLPSSERIRVVDIGANPIDGTPPYKSLLEQGKVELIGFEPQEDALQELNRRKGPHEYYLPHAVGTGHPATLYVCRASGMTSTLRPNFNVLRHFQGYPIWAEVLREVSISTTRLDDIEAIDEIDWLKIDIQGGELAVFQNGNNKLRNTLVIQTEVNFIALYENQPLFADIDQWMRSHGFMLHALLEQRRRLYAPCVLNGQIHEGLNQLTTADAVYVRDVNSLERLTGSQRRKLASILREAYGSQDLALKIEIMDMTT